MKRLLGLPLRAGNATVTEISGVPAYNPNQVGNKKASDLAGFWGFRLFRHNTCLISDFQSISMSYMVVQQRHHATHPLDKRINEQLIWSATRPAALPTLQD